MPLILYFLLGLVPCVIAWRLTRRTTPRLAATIRAACVSLFLVPAFAPVPSLHGALLLPAWMVLVWGPGEIGIGRTIGSLLFPPGMAFLILSLVLRLRRSATTIT